MTGAYPERVIETDRENKQVTIDNLFCHNSEESCPVTLQRAGRLVDFQYFKQSDANTTGNFAETCPSELGRKCLPTVSPPHLNNTQFSSIKCPRTQIQNFKWATKHVYGSDASMGPGTMFLIVPLTTALINPLHITNVHTINNTFGPLN